MLNRLQVNGFRALHGTSVNLSPFSILIGKNGVGKTTLLDVVQIIGKYARGGAKRAFGPPPWSLGWQRSKGIGWIETVDFELEVSTNEGKKYRYLLKLSEKLNQIQVREERLTRLSDNTT